MTKNHMPLLRDAIALRRAGQEDDSYENIFALHKIGGGDLFRACARLCKDGDAIERTVGAIVLGQLGSVDGELPYHDQSLLILMSLLNDESEHVLDAAIHGLGHHRADGVLVQHLHLSDHCSPIVRHAMAMALGIIEHGLVTDTLIKLSEDDDEGVRDWATFALGTQSDRDDGLVRRALIARLDDTDATVRYEALMGMTKRKMPEAIPALIVELGRDEPDEFILEAVLAMPSAALLPALRAYASKFDPGPCIDEAMDLCRKSA